MRKFFLKTCLIFIVLIAILMLNCTKNAKSISEDSVLEENEGILIFKVNHPFDHILLQVDYTIEGFDVSKPDVPLVSKIWVHTKKGTSDYYKVIVPAGRYRFEKVSAITDDPRISNVTAESEREIVYKPRYSFYVVRKAINFLGTFQLNETNKKEGLEVLKMYSSEMSAYLYFTMQQNLDMSIYYEFQSKYSKLAKQTIGLREQNISFRPWDRVYQRADSLAEAPQFQNGYKSAKWKSSLKITKNLLENIYDNPKLEVINEYKLIDVTIDEEKVIYAFNSLNDVKYPIGGLFKISILRNKSFKEVFEEFKTLYGTYNEENGKVIWRLINNQIVLKKAGEQQTSITILSMEYIRKLMQFNRSMASVLED